MKKNEIFHPNEKKSSGISPGTLMSYNASLDNYFTCTCMVLELFTLRIM